MLSLLKTKLAVLVQTKVGAAVLATLMVAGGGTAVAVTATHGNLSNVGTVVGSLATNHHETPAAENGDNAANHKAVEGTLTAYDSSTNTITVQPEHGSAMSFVVTSDTKINGEVNASKSGDGQQSTGKASNGQPSTEQQNASQQSNAEHTSKPSDLTTAVGHKVQVQATKNSDGDWVATKVTIEGVANGEQNSQQGSDQDTQGTPGTDGHSTSGGHEATPTAGGDAGHEPTEPVASPTETVKQG